MTPLIALHWMEGTAESAAAVLDPLIAGLPVWLITPRGPYPHPGGGRTWFPASYYSDTVRQPELLSAAADRLAGMLPDEPAVITGWSQGGDLSFALAVRHPRRVRAALPVLGMLPEACWPADGARLPPVHAFHGEQDVNVPITTARATAARLAARGVPITLHTYPNAGHDFAAPMRAEWRRILADLLG